MSPASTSQGSTSQDVAEEPRSTRQALDDIIRPALEQPPCLVSFSGGRDSSALLAWATDLARREGLPLPVPATLVIPGDRDADEHEWQSHVLTHLGLDERILIRVRDEMDCVGPVATDALRRHGLLWPFNTHMHIPIFAAARGGSIITGFAGDELGRASASLFAAQVLTRRRRPNRKDPLILGLAVSPGPVRRAVFRHRNRAMFDQLSWLRPEARLRLTRETAAHDTRVPTGWPRLLLEEWPRQRYFRIAQHSLAVAAAPWSVTVVNPFNHPLLHAALAARDGFGGAGSRTQLVTSLFDQVLPRSILTRRSKAAFSNVLFTDTARDFARSWSGGGVDSALVDADALRDMWTRPDVPADMRTMTLLQHAWLHDHVADATAAS